MRIVKPLYTYNNLVKFKPFSGLKNTQLSKLQQQYFSLGSCISSKKNETDHIKISVSGSEQLATLASVSKKNKRLSLVEEKDRELINKLKEGNLYYPYESPEDRAISIIKEELKQTFRQSFLFFTGVKLGNLEHEFFDRHTDILIIGGGPVGLSIAFALRSKFPFGPKVMVVDKDSSFPRASTNLGQSFVTQQLFSDEEEIEILKYGTEFFSGFSRYTEIEDIEFKLPYDPLGTLILADCSNAETILRRHDRMKLHGIHNKILNQQSLKEKFPWLNTEGVLFGSLSMQNEGVIDPWAYLQGLRHKAYYLGVEFVTAEVIDFGCNDFDVRRAICKLPNGTYNSIDFAHCVIAAGLESLNIVQKLNELHTMDVKINLPLEERMRYEYCLHSFNGPGLNTPTVIGSDGTYLRRVGLSGHYVAGVPSIASDLDPYHIFESRIKPFLTKRTPGFHKVDLVKGWIDAYEFCTSNEVGIAGPHPDTNKIVFALGFSHLGLQQLPALARAVMEWLYHKEYVTIDFTPFHVENLWRKQHLEADQRRRELLESQQRATLPG